MPAGLLIALGVFVGAYFGAKLAGAVSATTMKRFYAVFLLLVACYFLFSPTIEPKPANSVERAFGPERRPRLALTVVKLAQAVHCPPDLSS